MRQRQFVIVFASAVLTVLLASAVIAQDAPATPTPAAPGLAAGVSATVNTGGPRLRVRAEPSLSAAIVARLTNGSVVNAVARDASGDWVLVPLPEPASPYGWTSATYLRLGAPVMTLPVLAAAPTPAPAATPGATPSLSASTPVTRVLATPQSAPGLYGKLAIPIFDENRKTYDVWLVDADGNDLRRVVEQASSPALSDDGALLAYRRWKVDDRGIVVANADGSNPLRITDKLEDVLPSFSPDRTKVAFSTYRWGDRKSRLYYAWTDEQNKVAWEWGAGGIFGEDPYWTTDGRIIFRVTRPERAVEELWSMDGGTGENRTLLYITSSIRAPVVSPDNRTVAFMALVDGDWELLTLDLQDRTVKQLTENTAEDGLPVYSPNGEYIAFVSNRGGDWGLYRMRSDGTAVQLITALPGPIDGRVEFEPEYLNRGWLEEQLAWSR